MHTLQRYLSVVLVVACLPSVAFALDVPLTYQRYPDEYGSFRPNGYNQLEAAAQPPAADWKLPSLNSKKPLYVLAELGSDKVLFILDAQKTDVDYYDRLYFDENVNKDMTDDPVIDGTKEQSDDPQRWWCQFPAINTTVTIDGTVQPYSFKPGLSRYVTEVQGDEGKSSEVLRFYFMLNCCYSGEFDLDGKKYKLMLGDGNVNGRFDDRPVLQSTDEGRPAVPDTLYISSDGEASYYDRQPMADLWFLGGTLYEAALDPAAMKLALTPSSQKTATFRLPDGIERLSLVGEGGSHSVLVCQGGNRINIPPGSYQLFGYQLLRKEESGDVWRLGATCEMEAKKSPVFVLPEGGEVDLAIGEPFTPRVMAAKASTGKAVRLDEATSDVRLSLRIEGAAKETVAYMSRISGSNTAVPMSSSSTSLPKEAQYKILKADGEIVASGQFEYG